MYPLSRTIELSDESSDPADLLSDAGNSYYMGSSESLGDDSADSDGEHGRDVADEDEDEDEEMEEGEGNNMVEMEDSGEAAEDDKERDGIEAEAPIRASSPVAATGPRQLSVEEEEGLRRCRLAINEDFYGEDDDEDEDMSEDEEEDSEDMSEDEEDSEDMSEDEEDSEEDSEEEEDGEEDDDAHHAYHADNEEEEDGEVNVAPDHNATPADNDGGGSEVIQVVAVDDDDEEVEGVEAEEEPEVLDESSGSNDEGAP